MKILHVTSHLGGGLGTVILPLAGNCPGEHTITLLEAPHRGILKPPNVDIWTGGADNSNVLFQMHNADIVLVHYYDHPAIARLLSRPIPDCRLVFWAHKNVPYSAAEIQYPDRFFDTSPVQGHGAHIWSTGDMSRFLAIKPKAHEGFNIGTVASPKLHPEFLLMCHKIGLAIPDAHFTILGEAEHLKPRPPWYDDNHRLTFTGKVDDTAPYLAEMDAFGYPLRPDHYGTCEQVLGEAMAAGVVPVIMKNPAERLCVYDTGFICNSPQHYVDTFKYLNDNRGRFAVECRRHAANLYNIDRMIDSWHLVFEDMLKEPKRKRGVLT